MSFFKIDKKGSTRIVILIGKFAIKIANFTYSHQHFLFGCSANWNERTHCKTFKNFDNDILIIGVAPSYFCSWFGLIQIQARCEPCEHELTNEQIEKYKELHNGDYKKENFGYYKNKLVCLDYP